MIQLIPSKNDVFIFTERLGSFGREFHYFGTVESFLCPPLKKKKNFPLTSISSFSSPLGLLLWNIVGSQIIVRYRAPAGSLSSCCWTAGQSGHGPHSSLWSVEVEPDFDLRRFPDQGSTKIYQSEATDAAHCRALSAGIKCFSAVKWVLNCHAWGSVLLFYGAHILERFYNLPGTLHPDKGAINPNIPLEGENDNRNLRKQTKLESSAGKSSLASEQSIIFIFKSFMGVLLFIFFYSFPLMASTWKQSTEIIRWKVLWEAATRLCRCHLAEDTSWLGLAPARCRDLGKWAAAGRGV